MPIETTPQDNLTEDKGEALSAAALIRARRAELDRMIQAQAPVETDETAFETGADLWDLLSRASRS